MNATPMHPEHDDREHLARLLPGPVEQDLPIGRHHHIQEFVMSQIHQDGHAARRTSKRRPFFLAAGLTTAAAATAAAVVMSVGASGGSTAPRASRSNAATQPAESSLSGQQVLLAAATTAEQTPAGSGTYWYVKTVYTKTYEGKGGSSSIETWTRRDGRSWVRLDSGKVTDNGGSHGTYNNGFFVESLPMSYEKIQQLPTDPAALKKWISTHIREKHVRDEHGKPMGDFFVRGALFGLLSDSPAPPAVRAAGFRALAAMPNVKNLGPVTGGVGLQISDSSGTSRIVIDPKTSRLRSSNYAAPGAKMTGSTAVEAAEWTNQLPQ